MPPDDGVEFVRSTVEPIIKLGEGGQNIVWMHDQLLASDRIRRIVADGCDAECLRELLQNQLMWHLVEGFT
jgi:hypothetical protein